jgi:hypothetical protein
VQCLLIVAKDIEGGARRCSRDIAILTGHLGIKLENVRLQMLGRAKRVPIEKENTTLIDDPLRPSAAQRRCEG